MNPVEHLSGLLWGKTIALSLSSLARLGVADHMTGGPVTSDWLAEKTGAHAPSLYRVMRMVASLGVMEELPDRHFVLTPSGELLRSGVSGSLRDLAIMIGDPWQTRGYEMTHHVVTTGENGMLAAFGKNAFDLFPEIPDQAENFQRCMTGYSIAETEVLAPVMDFSPFRRIADVGGGHGMLLANILRQTPGLHGVLFDLPAVVAGAEPAGFLRDFAGRVTIEAGSMFEKVPAGCDAYVMKHIIHDWDDEAGIKILRHMRDGLAEHSTEAGRVFIAEMIIPDGFGPSPAKMLDIEMLVLTPGGRERTVNEFSAMLEASGLEMVGVKRTESPLALIEARVRFSF